MRRIFVLISSLVTSFALALSGLVFSPVNASAPADGTYECGSGTYKITTVESVTTFSDAGTCTGDVVIPEGVTTTSQYAFGYGNSQVNSVSLPESLTEIGNTPFYGTGLLTEINVASNNLAFASVGGVLFRLNGASASLIAYPGSKVESTYTTPATVSFAGGSPIPVTRIEAYALQGAKNLTTLNISEGVTTLGYGIAESATLLSTINLPDSYTAMTERPLGGATGLTALTIGAFVTSIQETSFTQTNNLNSITVDADNPDYSSLDGVLFNKDLTVLLAFPRGKANPYVVPSDVTHIGNHAFDSSTLASVSLPEGVTHIGNNAFWQSKVSSISLPDSLLEIATAAFQYSELTTVTIPKNVSAIGKYAFDQAFKLTSFTVDPDNQSYSSSLDGVLFNQVGTLLIKYPVGNPAASYAIPSGVQIIGEDSFKSAPNLTSVIFPTGISSIESEAFSCASYLTSFVFRGDAPTVANFAFGCISEPKAFIKSGNATFALDEGGKWNGLTVSEFDYFVNFDSKGGSAVSLSPFVTGGSGVSAPTAPTRDFYGFTGWSTTNSVSEGGTAVTFPYTPSGDITLFANWLRDGSYLCSTGGIRNTETTDTYSIYGGVVSNGSACTGDVVIPEGVVSISEWAFAYSQLLETIALPASVREIGNTAFQDSLLLENINVDTANAVFTSVDGVLFNKTLTQLEAYPAGKPPTSYTVPASVEIIDDRSFISSGSLKTVLFTLDSELTSLAGSVFQTSGLTSIILPAGVETIGNAFNTAQNLTSVTLPGSVTSIGAYAFQGSTRLSSFYFLGGPPTVEPETFTNIGPSPKAYIKSENTSFTADAEGKWNGLTVTFFDHFVNYDSNDGSEVSASPFAIGGSISAPTAPTRTGYTFSGWSTTDPGTAVSFPYTPGVASDITLFANWFEDGNFLCSSARAEVDDTNIYNITGGVVSNGSACTGDVFIPEGVTHIGTSAFGGSPMTSISLPNSLVEIGQQAFLGTGLTAITIPKNVSTMGLGVFQNAFELTSITVAEPNVNYTSSSDGVLFNEGSTKLLAYPLGKTATSYTIPSSVNIIGDRAFMGATLTSVIIPSGVSTVEDLAFFCASSLTSFYFLGNAPGTIGNSPFGCGSADAKAHVKNASVSSFALVDGKWNGLTVEIVDQPAIYVVTYNYNSATGGKTSVSSSFTTGGTPIKLPTPTRTGYTFAGWYSNSGLTTKIGNAGANYSPTGTTSALRAYAKWTKNVKAAAKVKPTVSGTAKVVKTLAANKGTWTGSPKPTHSYQWYACTKKVAAATSKIPSTCKKIPKATKSTFKLAKTQKGKYVTVLVSGTSTGTTKTSWLTKSTVKVR
jgi:uncharacterized repeat protein (TIGR02543 family)